MDDNTDVPPDGSTEPIDPESTAPAGASRSRRSPARWLLWAAVTVVALVALGFGAILIYANFINDPEDALTTSDLDAAVAGTTPENITTTVPVDTGSATTEVEDTAAPDTSPAATSPVVTSPSTSDDAPSIDGTWNATNESQLGYRVVEVLFGVDTEGVGRTNDITGSLTIAGTTVTEADFEVDMATVESDDSRRDGQFRGRIMTVSEFPTSDFVLTEPIELGRIPDPGEQITTEATGDLTLRGVTNEVTFEVTAQLQNDRIGVLGAIPIVFADYEIANPSISGISTEDNGLLEFVLVFER